MTSANGPAAAERGLYGSWHSPNLQMIKEKKL